MKKTFQYTLLVLLIIPAGFQIIQFLVWIGLVNTICLVLLLNLILTAYLYIGINVLKNEAERKDQTRDAEYKYLSDQLKNKK